ncbi:MAG: YggT family protein [Chloroflexi bacterium]|nr:YggT family protein [Chloroflexota bacterium]
MDNIGSFFGFLVAMLAWMIVARALLSWFPDTRNNQWVKILVQITDPVLVPISRIVPRFGAFDFSPMIAILVLFAVARALDSPI